MNFKKIILNFLIILFLIIPLNSLAYSKYIIPGGENIGIEVKSSGILIVGFYDVNGDSIGKKAGFLVGDKILKINNTEVGTIEEMIRTLENVRDRNVSFTILRNSVYEHINLKVIDDNGVIKTGLYVKDKINGIGTLTYVDPGTGVFGALGHEILEMSTASKFEIKSGQIYEASVTGIIKSRNGEAGEKNSTYNASNIFGSIKENTISGIFGRYSLDINNKERLEVADSSFVTVGDAIIRTVIENEFVEDFSIKILNIDYASDTKNILFQITDKKLLEETGGVIQGMSGSPIIQNNKIIGAVNYVIVNDTKKGYGIFITTMLEEGDS